MYNGYEDKRRINGKKREQRVKVEAERDERKPCTCGVPKLGVSGGCWL